MKWKGKNPIVKFIGKAYETSEKVEKKLMKAYESMMDRAEGIEKWFVTISPDKCKQALNMEIKIYSISQSNNSSLDIAL